MTDAALYTAGGVVIAGIVSATGALVVKWLEKRSDEKTHKDKLLVDTTTATTNELRTVIEILRAEADGAREEARKARQGEVDADNRWKQARDLALGWETERHTEHQRAMALEDERDTLRHTLTETERALARALADVDHAQIEARARHEQELRLLDDWTAKNLVYQLAYGKLALIATTVRDRAEALRAQVKRLGGDPGPQLPKIDVTGTPKPPKRKP